MVISPKDIIILALKLGVLITYYNKLRIRDQFYSQGMTFEEPTALLYCSAYKWLNPAHENQVDMIQRINQKMPKAKHTICYYVDMFES